MAAAAAGAAPVVIGEGAYGLVMKPALPNTNASGTWQEFPTNVTKIFFGKSAFNDVRRLSTNLPRIFGPNNGQRITPYRHTYKVKNLPANVRSRYASTANETVLYPVRMPDLGKSIDRIESFYKDLRKLPVLTILTQIQKLLHQLQKAKDTGYIHGDLRETNLMVNPSTGAMTIIDFDWLKPFSEFMDEYPFGFYCHPPETLVFYHRAQLRAGVSEATAESQLGLKSPQYKNTLRRQFLDVFDSLGYPRGIRFGNIINEALLEAADIFSKPTEEGGVDLLDSLKTFDSFGLALTLLKLLGYVYPGCVSSLPISDEMRETFKIELADRGICVGGGMLYCVEAILLLTHRVLIPMTAFKYSERMNIDTAVPIVDAIVATLGLAPTEAVSAASTVANTRRTRSKRRRSTRRRV